MENIYKSVDKPRLYPVMLGGTGSDVGKSVLAAGLCRIFLQDGYNPAPFKAQNMALNSYVTLDGLEIGRAQAVQAFASGIECRVEMNPVLLKPSGEMQAQVIVNGIPVGNSDAYSYFRGENRYKLREACWKAFDSLAKEYDPIVMEGAGSIAELNLKNRDIVNMSMAEYADAKVILVADIDRGGIFASVYGSIMLLDENERKRIAGIIVNKFRGDIRLFDEGRQILERITGVPVIGVMPYLNDLHIEEEDSVSLNKKAKTATNENKVNVAIVTLPHISNFTDFDTISLDPRVHVYYTLEANELEKADIIIIPGSKNTIADLYYLKEIEIDKVLKRMSEKGITIFGICGGYQIMGEKISDPFGVEGEEKHTDGLGLLPIQTVLVTEKRLTRMGFRLHGSDEINKGYEIHMGISQRDATRSSSFAVLETGEEEGCMLNNRIMGTYLHGCLDNREVIALIVNPIAEKMGLDTPDYITHDDFMDHQFDKLAEAMRCNIDIEKLYKIIRKE